jgi:energy-coupling factor transporter ATP-binding protein EcfA2
MKIVQLTAENLKKIKVVDITPTSDFIQITGKNGSGKTSVLDSIWWALGGKDAIQGKPIREGANRAMIRLKLGEITIERTFTEHGTTLKVENADGARYPSPQAMLDDLIGELSFDPLAFAHMKPRDQYDELKRVAKLELDLEKLEGQNKADADRRREKSREAKDARSRASGIVIRFPEMKARVDVRSLLAQIESASRTNAAANTAALKLERLHGERDTLQLEITNLQKQLEVTKQKHSATAKLIADFPTIPEPINLAPLHGQVEDAEAKNADYRNRFAKAEHENEAERLEAEAQLLTDQIEARNAAKAKALEAAAMPIPGLSLGDGRVFFNDVPFEQCSSAEQLRTSVAIAMAANPKLRVIRIKDGSLLDDDGLRMIADLARDQDYQVWIERVDSSGKIGIVMEDGAVVTNNDTVAVA